MKNVVEITSAKFEEDVLQSAVPVLVDFSSKSCLRCRLLAPILEEVASELAGNLAVLKVDVSENMELATRLGITALPTAVVFKHGREVARLIGLQNRERLLEAVRAT